MCATQGCSRGWNPLVSKEAGDGPSAWRGLLLAGWDYEANGLKALERKRENGLTNGQVRELRDEAKTASRSSRCITNSAVR
jgi:hypothetical protein